MGFEAQFLTTVSYALLHFALFSASVALLCAGVWLLSQARKNWSRSRWWDMRREMAEFAHAGQFAEARARRSAPDPADWISRPDGGARQWPAFRSWRSVRRFIVRALIGVLALVGAIAIVSC